MIRARRTRRGFTLVELLVASAMMIMGMWLLSWVYQQGLESFRQARSQANLTAQQRMVTSVLTRDLQANHFLDDDTKPNHGRRLSDQTKGWLDGTYTPPKGGFFRARSADNTKFAPSTPTNPNPNVWEAGLDGFDSSYSVNHYLHFTVLLPGGPDHQNFIATVPAISAPGKPSTPYFGTAAEVVYYLKANGLRTRSGSSGLPLFDLYRQQRIVAQTNDDAPAYASAMAANSTDYVSEVMVTKPGNAAPGTQVTMATLSDLTIPVMSGQPSVRLAGPDTFTPIGLNPSYPARFSTDKLMSNVLSFEVKFTGQLADGGYSGGWPRSFASGNTDYPYDTLPYDGRYDTFSTQVSPGPWNAQGNYASSSNPGGPMKPLRITGVMIRIRTYDTRTYTARQTTLTLDL